MTIGVVIVGYGNLVRGIECLWKYIKDMELKAAFTRRKPGISI